MLKISLRLVLNGDGVFLLLLFAFMLRSTRGQHLDSSCFEYHLIAYGTTIGYLHDARKPDGTESFSASRKCGANRGPQHELMKLQSRLFCAVRKGSCSMCMCARLSRCP
ncbi:hypothetical protein F4678DRAFT_289906 [Xylaria arbuscula]|nr:hypothetical protein F4678DRAFT_289906 [Xylaria arbuscula]